MLIDNINAFKEKNEVVYNLPIRFANLNPIDEPGGYDCSFIDINKNNTLDGTFTETLFHYTFETKEPVIDLTTYRDILNFAQARNKCLITQDEIDNSNLITLKDITVKANAYTGKQDVKQTKSRTISELVQELTPFEKDKDVLKWAIRVDCNCTNDEFIIFKPKITI